MTVPVDELLIAFGLFKRVQVLALDILDQRELGRGRLVDLAHDRRNRMEPGTLGRPPATLASDDLIVLTIGAKQNRLKHAPFGDRIGELIQGLFVEPNARLVRIGLDPRNLDVPNAPWPCHRIGGLRLRLLTEQCRKAAAEAARPAHAATASWGKRPISSRASRIYAAEPGHL